jgi:regulator of protease activity HflC (stomatin/prohibitin superfamily)
VGSVRLDAKFHSFYFLSGPLAFKSVLSQAIEQSWSKFLTRFFSPPCSFPLQWQLVDFSTDKEGFGGSPLSVFSNNGQTVVLDVSFYFRIDETKLFEIYQLAALNYVGIIERKSQEVLKNIASRFSTTEFFTTREAIAATMLTELNKALYDVVYVFVPSFQLRGVSLPADLEKALVDKVVADQNKRTEELKRNITIIQADTQVLQAQAQANVTVVIQQATSNAFQVTETAKAQAKKTVLDAQSIVLLTLKNGLGFTNNSQLFNYMYAQQISSASASSKLLVGFDGAQLLIQN